jgi:rhodanese-related sulfurtransferase
MLLFLGEERATRGALYIGGTMQAIDTAHLRARMERRDPLALVDVAPPNDYRVWHMEGTINVPLDEHFEVNATQQLPDRSLEVVVCDGATEGSWRAYAAGKLLLQLGYEHVCTHGLPGRMTEPDEPDAQIESGAPTLPEAAVAPPAKEPPRDRVDRAGWDSFPASDPPPFR